MSSSPDPETPGPADTPRRSFLKWATASLASLVGLVLAIPFVDALVRPALRVKPHHFARVGPVDVLPSGEPVDQNFADETRDAFIRQTEIRSVWAIKHSRSDVTVFSPICPHLGCRYDWQPDERHFVCPCHGSVYSIDGTVLGGPAPRPLDTLPHRIEEGDLYVEWERFKVGIAKKVVV